MIDKSDIDVYGVVVGLVLMSYAIGYQRAVAEVAIQPGAVTGPQTVLFAGVISLIGSAALIIDRARSRQQTSG